MPLFTWHQLGWQVEQTVIWEMHGSKKTPNFQSDCSLWTRPWNLEMEPTLIKAEPLFDGWTRKWLFWINYSNSKYFNKKRTNNSMLEWPAVAVARWDDNEKGPKYRGIQMLTHTEVKLVSLLSFNFGSKLRILWG